MRDRAGVADLYFARMASLKRFARSLRDRLPRRPASGSTDTGASALPESAAPAGSRRVDSPFFAAYDRFYETSETSARPWRLNLRYDAIFSENAGAFQGARVLDIASHDARWTLAALRTGAAHVTAIEARPELVAEARENLTHYDVEEDSFTIVTGDVFTVLAEDHPKVDTILCLGFFYHTLRYVELWKRMDQCSPRTIIIDTEVHQGSNDSLVRVTDEPVSRQGNAVPDEFSTSDLVLTGRPTIRAMEVMARAYGFQLTKQSDWAAIIRDNPQADGIGDYRRGKRVTLRFDRI